MTHISLILYPVFYVIGGEPIAVLSHNKAVFYCVPSTMFELMVDQLSDGLLMEKAVSRMDDPEIDVSWDDL